MPSLYTTSTNYTASSTVTNSLYAYATSGTIITGTVQTSYMPGLYQGSTSPQPTGASSLINLFDNNGNVNFYLDPQTNNTTIYANAMATTSATVDLFIGDGTTKNFTLSRAPISMAYMTVSVGGVAQEPYLSWSLTGTNTLSFVQAPPYSTITNIICTYFSSIPLFSYTGAQGTIGSQGLTGSGGVQGIQGLQGPRNGAQGTAGTNGTQGAIGATGPSGYGIGQFGSAVGSINILTTASSSTVAQYQYTIAIGYNSGIIDQKQYSTAIGYQAGEFDQGQYYGLYSAIYGHAIAIGSNSGNWSQGANGIAIGQNAGNFLQIGDSVAIGQNAGNYAQGYRSVAVGSGAGQNYQGGTYPLPVGSPFPIHGGVAVGYQAGNDKQSYYGVAVGYNAGQYTQGIHAVAIGYHAGTNYQSSSTIAIGDYAAYTNQSANAVAIGNNAGYTTQGAESVGIGHAAAYTNQSSYCVAIGGNAGQANQGTGGTSIGNFAGSQNQGMYSVALGYEAGYVYQGNNAIAIGYQAGTGNPYTAQGQGANSIAIGYQAGVSFGVLSDYQQAANTIILNATGANLNSTSTNNAFFVKPVRHITYGSMPPGFYNMAYNPTTGEIIYWT